jgi:hypothetical protein
MPQVLVIRTLPIGADRGFPSCTTRGGGEVRIGGEAAALSETGRPAASKLALFGTELFPYGWLSR